jgi:hypothetical protein
MENGVPTPCVCPNWKRDGCPTLPYHVGLTLEPMQDLETERIQLVDQHVLVGPLHPDKVTPHEAVNSGSG